jgi:heme/copper-type cytochrome/quinol oxidase subunit 4
MSPKGTRSKKHLISLGLSVSVTIISYLVLFGIREGISHLTKSNKDIGSGIAYIIYGVIIAVSCYFICRKNPDSLWYAPVICNATGIIAAIFLPSFWAGGMWVVIACGWLISLIASINGAFTGRGS